MANPALDVFGLGQCSLDCLTTVERYPPPDVKCEVQGLVLQGGGPVATALVALSRWGLSTAFAGVTGDDLWGRMICESLAAEGVETSGLLVRQGCGSQFAYILAEPGIGRRTIFWRRPTGEAPAPGEIGLGLARRARLLHTDGFYPEASLAAAREAREAGVQVSVDAGSLREGMLDLCRLSDFFLASLTFARAFAGEEDPLAVCRRLAELGPRVTGVTLGAEGYVALAGGRVIRGPAYPAAAVDTTGCGDVFHAGFAYGFLQGWDVEKSLDFGAWAAALVARELGGRTGIPSLEKVREWGG